MKRILLFFIAILIISCHTKQTESGLAYIPETDNKKNIGKKLFEYDEIDYYHINFDEIRLNELYDNQYKTEIDSFKMGVILDIIPKDNSDLKFIDKLEEIGYIKRKIAKSKFKEIDNVFSDQPIKKRVTTGCTYTYRDILIFKKNNTVVGTVKICFDCEAIRIIGTSANTNNIGLKDNYSILEDILKV